MKICRIVSTILCAICLAALPLVGILTGMDYLVIPLLGAGIFFALMLFFRKKQMEQEERENPTPSADFFHPLPKEETDEDKTTK